jgi:hypothetical protein
MLSLGNLLALCQPLQRLAGKFHACQHGWMPHESPGSTADAAQIRQAACYMHQNELSNVLNNYPLRLDVQMGVQLSVYPNIPPITHITPPFPSQGLRVGLEPLGWRG